jgi:hypothetical protein
MTNCPTRQRRINIGVARKIESSEYQPYACGSIFRAPSSQPNLPISGWALLRKFAGNQEHIGMQDGYRYHIHRCQSSRPHRCITDQQAR